MQSAHDSGAPDEVRFVFYGETDSGRLLAVDAGQKKDYLARRLRGE